MTEISHQRFRRYIQSALHQRLGEKEQRLLDEHLSTCEGCRAYAEEVQALESDIRRVLHTRLDALPGPSSRLPGNIQEYSKSRMVSKPAFGFASALAMVAVIAILVLAIHRTLPKQNLLSGVAPSGSALPTTQPLTSTAPAAPPRAIAPKVPAAPTEAVPPAATSTQSVQLPWRTEPITYTVQVGDTILGIAQKYELKPESVYWANIRLIEENENRLTPGLVLWIPPYDGVTYEWEGQDGRGKDDLDEVAAMFGVASEDIVNWPGNGLDADVFARGIQPEIPPGTRLFIPGARGGASRALAWSFLGITRATPEQGKDLGVGFCQGSYEGVVGMGSFQWPADRSENPSASRSWGKEPDGIDLSAQPGDLAYAADQGVVVYAGPADNLPGETVIIDHGNTWLTLYSGLADLQVQCGAGVNQGSPLGTIVSTKSPSGIQGSGLLLHFELAQNGNFPVNPLDYLPAPNQDFSASFAWSPKGDIIAVGSQTGLRLYDIATLGPTAALVENESCNGPIVFGDNLLAAINGDWLRVWNASSNQLLFSIKDEDPINFQSLAISPDGQLVATGEQKRIRVWSAGDGSLLATLPVDGFVSNLAITRDGNGLIAAVQWQAQIMEWDLNNLELVQSHEFPRDVFFFTISLDATTMIVDYGQPGLELWDLSTLASRRYYEKVIGASGFTRIAPDNNMAAVWGYNDTDGSAAAIWDLQNETMVHEFTRGGKLLASEWKSVEFSPDGQTIAISDDLGYIHIYELSSGKEIGLIYLDYRYKP